MTRQGARISLRSLLAVQSAIAEVLTTEGVAKPDTPLVQVMERVLGVLGPVFDGPVAVAWRVDESGRRLETFATWASDPATFADFLEITRRLTFAPGEGLPGTAWEAGASVWVSDLQHRDWPRKQAWTAAGLHTAAAFVLTSPEGFQGVIEFYGLHERERSEDLCDTLDALGRRIGLWMQLRAVATERHAEQLALSAALRLREEQFRLLAENIAVAFHLRQVDPPAYLYVSPAFERITGFPAQTLHDDPGLMASMVHPDDTDATISAGASAGERLQSEHRIVRADGEVRWVRVSSTPVADAATGRINLFAGITDDITEHVEAMEAIAAAEAEARAANAAKNAFLSRMSHELRTPLNAILGFGQILERRLDGTQYADSVHHVVRAGRHLLALINDVLDISRIETGDMAMSLEPVALQGVVKEAMALLRPLAETGGVGLILEGGGDDVFVMADAARLLQVALNLVSNAVKYNRPGGRVWVSWSSSGGGEAADAPVVLTVRDDGPGIAVELQDRLFVPFDRLGAEAGAVEGTGVGLSVTKALVELMNGTIAVESKAGHGAAFHVTLPAGRSPELVINRAGVAAARLPDRGGPLTVLYIEDNPSNVHVMRSVVQLRPEWVLEHAALGTLGVDIAVADPPDLILLDLHLPDRTGESVLRELKSHDATAGVATVFLSADATPGQIRRSVAAGALRYLTKPLDIDEVLALLDEIARERQSRPRP